MPPKKRARTATAAAEPAVVVCYGDSNTHGANSEGDTRLPLSSRWTTHLASALGSEVLVVPEGLNGRTTVIDGVTHPTHMSERVTACESA